MHGTSNKDNISNSSIEVVKMLKKHAATTKKEVKDANMSLRKVKDNHSDLKYACSFEAIKLKTIEGQNKDVSRQLKKIETKLASLQSKYKILQKSTSNAKVENKALKKEVEKNKKIIEECSNNRNC